MLPQVPAHLGHQLLGFLHLIPCKRFEILLPQHFNCAVSRSLRSIRFIILIIFEMLFDPATTLTFAHLCSQVFSLTWCIEMFCQSFELRGRQTHFLLVAFGCSRRFVPLLILAISHIPVVQVHLIEKRFLLVFRQQTTFERIVEFFFVSYVNIIQCTARSSILRGPTSMPTSHRIRPNSVKR